MNTTYVSPAVTGQQTSLQIMWEADHGQPWWASVTGDFDQDPIPAAWTAQVTGVDPMFMDRHADVAEVGHEEVVAALQRIVQGDVVVSQECRATCAQFLADPEYSEFDAGSADEVLQVIVWDEVRYS